MTSTRIGIIGAGWCATESHIPVLQSQPDVEVTSICGLEPEHLRKVQRRFGISHATEDYRQLLARDRRPCVAGSDELLDAEMVEVHGEELEET